MKHANNSLFVFLKCSLGLQRNNISHAQSLYFMYYVEVYGFVLAGFAPDYHQWVAKEEEAASEFLNRLWVGKIPLCASGKSRNSHSPL